MDQIHGEAEVRPDIHRPFVDDENVLQAIAAEVPGLNTRIAETDVGKLSKRPARLGHNRFPGLTPIPLREEQIECAACMQHIGQPIPVHIQQADLRVLEAHGRSNAE